jgi:hypothetical protein
MVTILLLVSLFVKHFIIDFLIQPPYMYKNKGNLFHPGGWIHAGLHGAATWAIILFITNTSMGLIVPFWYITFLAVFEILIHYAMDFTKINVCKSKGYTPTTHEEWFTWLGIDQTVHSLTYVLIAAMLI